jgi:hypothetical protein
MKTNNSIGILLFVALFAFAGPVNAQSLTIEIPEAELNKSAEEGDADVISPDGTKLTDRMAEQIKTLIRLALQTGDASAFETALFDLTSASPGLAVAIAAFTTTEVKAQVAAKTEQAAAPTDTDVPADETSETALSDTESESPLTPAPLALSTAFTPISAGLAKSLTVAATIGPAKATPAKFREIMAATSKIIAEDTPASSAQDTLAQEATDSSVEETEETSAEIELQQELMQTIQQQVQQIVVEYFEIENITAESNLEDIVNLLPAAGVAEIPTTESASPTG